MHYAFVLSLCVVAASPAPPTAELEMEAAARSFRIESYNRHREDRERYQQLRDADDELRLGLSATAEANLARRQVEATAWYREAANSIHSGGEVPATPTWLPEALADAAAGKLRAKKLSPGVKANSLVKETRPTAPGPSALPPTISPTKTEEEARTPFFFVDAALKAAENFGSGSSNAGFDPEFEVKEPVIDPPGPIVDTIPALEPASELPTIEPIAAEPEAVETSESAVEPTLELPTLDAPAIELPGLPSLDEEASN